MKIAIFTSNGIRHKYFANTIAEHTDNALIFSEAKPYNISFHTDTTDEVMEAHFYERYQAEEKFFKGNDAFRAPTVTLMYNELNTEAAFSIVKKYNPDIAFVFSSSIIKDPLLSFLPPGRFVNLHLGISPYYRGTGTNFWPFVNKELEYVGATIHHVSAGVDAGDIIAHVRPCIEKGDNVHTIGCKTIKEGVEGILRTVDIIRNGGVLRRVPQWNVENEKYYRKTDFTRAALEKYFENMKNGMIEQYLGNEHQPIRLIDFEK